MKAAGMEVEWLEVATLEDAGHGVLFFHRDIPRLHDNPAIAFLEGWEWMRGARHARIRILSADSPVLKSAPLVPEHLIAETKVGVLTVLLLRETKGIVETHVTDKVCVHFNA